MYLGQAKLLNCNQVLGHVAVQNCIAIIDSVILSVGGCAPKKGNMVITLYNGGGKERNKSDITDLFLVKEET